jgi:hypothetical protein
VTTDEKSSNQVDDVIREEIGSAIKSVQEENNRKYKYYVVALLLIYVAIFHDLGMGISYTDLAGMDCQSSDYDPSGYTEIDEVFSELDTEISEWCQETKGEAQLIVIIAFAGAAFCVWQANKPSKNEEPQEEIALSPLEDNKESLKRKKLVEKWSGAVVLIICIYCISLMITPTEITGLYEKTGTGPVLMMNAIEALDVNNCLDKAYDNGGAGWDSNTWSQVRCPKAADSAKETIVNLLTIMILANIIGYFVLKKSKVQICNIQDSITEMEEE